MISKRRSIDYEKISKILPQTAALAFIFFKSLKGVLLAPPWKTPYHSYRQLFPKEVRDSSFAKADVVEEIINHLLSQVIQMQRPGIS